MKIFLVSSLVIILLTLIFFIFHAPQNKIPTPPQLRIPGWLNNIPFLPTNFICLMLSFLVLIFYVPVCLYLLLRFFENTQTTEIIFFTGFLIACLAETARFITICLGLWLSFSDMLIFSGKIVLFGRTLAPLSFLCAALLSETAQRQDIERNYTVMIIISIVFAALIPMNTARITSTGLISEGFMNLINTMRFFIIATTFLSFLIHGITKNNSEQKQLALFSLLIYISYALLVSCDNLCFLILGSLGLAGGTYFYFLNLHRLYMWG